MWGESSPGAKTPLVLAPDTGRREGPTVAGAAIEKPLSVVVATCWYERGGGTEMTVLRGGGGFYWACTAWNGGGKSVGTPDRWTVGGHSP